MKDVRPWTYATLFGTLWGAIEATLGTALYLSQLPMRGTIIGVAGLLCLVCLRRLQPRPGVCLLAGIVAIFLKVFTLGGFYIGPIMGIAVQALALEFAFSASRSRAIGAALGGFIALATNPIQMVLKMWVVMGADAVQSYLRLLHEAAAAVGFGDLRPEAVFGLIVVGKGLMGVAGGYWAWWIAGRVMRRLGNRS